MVMNNSDCFHLTYVHFTDQRIIYLYYIVCLTFKYLHIFYVVAIIEHFYMLFSAFVLNSIQFL